MSEHAVLKTAKYGHWKRWGRYIWIVAVSRFLVLLRRSASAIEWSLEAPMGGSMIRIFGVSLNSNGDSLRLIFGLAIRDAAEPLEFRRPTVATSISSRILGDKSCALNAHVSDRESQPLLPGASLSTDIRSSESAGREDIARNRDSARIRECPFYASSPTSPSHDSDLVMPIVRTNQPRDEPFFKA